LTGNSNIVAAEYFTDTAGADGAGIPMSGAFGSAVVNVSATLSVADLAALSSGIHSLYVHGKDAAGNWGPFTSTSLNIIPNALFSDGFESGNFAAWSSAVNSGSRINVTAAAQQSGAYGMQALISGNTSGYVQDDTPNGETTYHARFYFHPNGVTITNAHSILVGLNSSNQAAFRVQLRRNAGQYQIRATVVRSGGTTNTSWYTISNAYHSIEIAWESALSASFSLYIDGALKQTLTGLNTSIRTLDKVRLGPQGNLNSAAGAEYFDNFASTRFTVIGP
jgi:hypothetical protein